MHSQQKQQLHIDVVHKISYTYGNNESTYNLLPSQQQHKQQLT